MELAVKILGSGCDKCEDMKNAVEVALSELNLDIKIDHVTDLVQIVSYGVMSTPALVVGEKVVSVGRELTKEEIVEILKGEGYGK